MSRTTAVRIPALDPARATIQLVDYATLIPVIGFDGPEWATHYENLELTAEAASVELTPTADIATVSGAPTGYLVTIASTGRRRELFCVQVPVSDVEVELADLVGASAIDPADILAGRLLPAGAEDGQAPVWDADAGAWIPSDATGVRYRGWMPASSGISGVSITAYYQAASGMAWCLTSTGVLYRRDTPTSLWVAKSTGIVAELGSAIDADPANADVLHATVGGKVYRTSAATTTCTWTQLYTPTLTCARMDHAPISAHTHKVWLAGINSSCAWHGAYIANSHVSLTVVELGEDTLLENDTAYTYFSPITSGLALHSGPYHPLTRTTDDCVSFTAVAEPGMGWGCVLWHPSVATKAWAFTSGVWVTDDAGATWDRIGTYPSAWAQDTAPQLYGAHTLDGTTIYVVNRRSGGLVVSTDGGAHWAIVPAVSGIYTGVRAAADGYVYLWGTAGLDRYDPATNTVTDSSSGIASAIAATRLYVCRHGHQYLASNNLLYRRGPGDMAWTKVSAAPPGVTNVVADAADPDRVMVWVAGYFYLSIDGGETWGDGIDCSTTEALAALGATDSYSFFVSALLHQGRVFFSFYNNAASRVRIWEWIGSAFVVRYDVAGHKPGGDWRVNPADPLHVVCGGATSRIFETRDLYATPPYAVTWSGHDTWSLGFAPDGSYMIVANRDGRTGRRMRAGASWTGAEPIVALPAAPAWTTTGGTDGAHMVSITADGTIHCGAYSSSYDFAYAYSVDAGDSWTIPSDQPDPLYLPRYGSGAYIHKGDTCVVALHASAGAWDLRTGHASIAGTMATQSSAAVAISGGSMRNIAHMGKLGLFGKVPIAQPVGSQQAAITLGNANNEIGGLTISATYVQAEVAALRDKCEELGDDVRNLSVLIHAIRTALVNLGIIKGAA